MEALRRRGLNASVSTQENDRYDFQERGIAWALRLSVHYYNTEQELEQAAEILREVLSGASGFGQNPG
ncbi:MAG: hypothetical protein HC821_03960 [Lewinella sp.]|nr:hypothetical protein [Lewinella sp.]